MSKLDRRLTAEHIARTVQSVLGNLFAEKGTDFDPSLSLRNQNFGSFDKFSLLAALEQHFDPLDEQELVADNFHDLASLVRMICTKYGLHPADGGVAGRQENSCEAS
jgi:hypothetical protein